jgi:flagellar secretion chaperone FliS
MLNRSAINRYKAVKVKTASPGQVLVMLYDGLLRFLAEGRDAMKAGNPGRAGEKIDRAFAIVSELLSTLRPEVAPELCEQLQGVYMFCMDQISQANIKQEPKLLDDCIQVLEPIRDGYRQVVEQGAGEPALRAS